MDLFHGNLSVKIPFNEGVGLGLESAPTPSDETVFMMTEIKNEISWSKTRDEVFRTCPRQYWFAYYGY
jgi:hypothetical protein